MDLKDGPESAFEQAETVRALDRLYQDAITRYRGGDGNVQLLACGERADAPDKLVLIANGKRLRLGSV